MNRALLIAFHYPPSRGSSGVQRTLAFSRYLADFGWEPIVLSANPRAYETKGDDQLRDIPANVVVERAFALDAARHLAIKGRYLDSTSYPDRWGSWWLGGSWSGMRLIRRYRPKVIWSTFPIPTAHAIAASLHRWSSVPWVADFRDSMTEENYPADPKRWAAYRRIERNAVHNSAFTVFTSPGTAQMYAQRYPEIPRERWRCILNGYDEHAFAAVEARTQSAANGTASAPIVLLHSGILYPSERDPRAFFAAVRELAAESVIGVGKFLVKLRASGYDSLLQRLIDEAGIGELVRLEPGIGYEQALAEMLAVDGLLLFQASNCNHQIPAKLYEYLRAGRPILALTDPIGDTAGVLSACRVDTVASLDSKDDIKAALTRFIGLVAQGRAPIAEPDAVQRYSRRAQTGELASLFDAFA